jgi:hypothetical protein
MNHISSLLGDTVHRVAAGYCTLVVRNINSSCWWGRRGGGRGGPLPDVVPPLLLQYQGTDRSGCLLSVRLGLLQTCVYFTRT